METLDRKNVGKQFSKGSITIETRVKKCAEVWRSVNQTSSFKVFKIEQEFWLILEVEKMKNIAVLEVKLNSE